MGGAYAYGGRNGEHRAGGRKRCDDGRIGERGEGRFQSHRLRRGNLASSEAASDRGSDEDEVRCGGNGDADQDDGEGHRFREEGDSTGRMDGRRKNAKPEVGRHAGDGRIEDLDTES